LHVRVHVDAIRPRALLAELGRNVEVRRARVVELDLSGLNEIDDIGVAALHVATRRLAAVGVRVELVGSNPKVAAVLAETPPSAALARPPDPGRVERIGQATLAWWRGTVALADMTLTTIVGCGLALVGRASFSLRELLEQIERIGTDALLIVASLSWLLGLVLAFQTWKQLNTFGTEQLVLEFVGIGMARGFAPFIVGVLLSGRTGSAIAAELATMEMRQENDALRVMGISPIRHLVVPRMLALTVVVPGINLIATALGIVGGLVVMLVLSPNWTAAFDRMVVNLALSDFWLGAVKAVLFGWVIGLISAFWGFNSGAGPVSIGLASTRAVVWSIFFIMVVDAIVTTIWTISQ
jgi:phospholipid/cholesterol/gamma-HCH transport system permease protein